MLKNTTLLLVGVALGLGIAYVGYLYAHRHTTVWTTTSDLTGQDGLRIPAGTDLIYFRPIPEGGDTVILYVDLKGATINDKIKQSVSGHSFLVAPVWAF